MTKKRAVPKFRSEAAEAKWWFEHRRETAGQMADAAAKGKTTTLKALLAKRREGGVTPSVSIRIDPMDLSRARVQAEKRGLRYQTYLKMVLHEALEREERKAG